jgi:hypothetical protein
MLQIDTTLAAIPADNMLIPIPTTATSMIDPTGVRVVALTRLSSPDAGSILSRDSASVSRVATNDVRAEIADA